MKKFALTITVLLTASGLCFAGPEQYSSSKEVKNVVQPAPPPSLSWTGFYIGGLAGYKYGVINTDTATNGNYNNETDFEQVTHDNAPDLSTSGAELGGLIGFNYQWHNWVFGAEAAGGYLWLRDSDSTEYTTTDFGGDDLRLSTSFKTHYLATFGGKFGYAFCRWLPYVTGGLAVGDLELHQQLLFQNDEGFRNDGSKSQTNAGWFVGGGLEYKLTDHWRLRGQYQYIDLGDVSFTRNDNFDDGYIASSSASLREHNVQFAIIYGF